jgi:peptide-methionine (S)-S-oxide reductase
MTRRRFLRAVSATLLTPWVGGLAAASHAEETPSGSIPVDRLNLPKSTWKKLLPSEAYAVLFEEATERAFTSPLNEEKRRGVFACAACYLPLFSSDAKYDSGTGRPSFVRSQRGRVETKRDFAWLLARSLHPLRWAPGPRVRRRTRADRSALLQQRRGAPLRARGRAAAAVADTPGIGLLVALAVFLCAPEAVAAPEGAPPAGQAAAVFAGGCFWCMEGPFDALDGVISTTSGYTGGRVPDPSYEQVSEGTTGHVEAVRVVYDPRRVDYTKLLDVFWHNVDPLDAGGQFCDRGSQYRSVIFVGDEAKKKLAEESRQKLTERFGRSIVTDIQSAGPFYAAEEYHQDYSRKNPFRYRFYRGRCGRDARLEAVWGAAPVH